MGWDDNNFPDASDPEDVKYMVLSWKVIQCRTCINNYKTESRQFEHLGMAATRREADAMFKKYVDMHVSRKNPNRKLYTLFLVEIIDKKHIQDVRGELIGS